MPSIGTTLRETSDGRTILRSSTSDPDWMARVLAGLDCPFAVRDPPELEEALSRHAEGLAALVGNREDEKPGDTSAPPPFS